VLRPGPGSGGRTELRLAGRALLALLAVTVPISAVAFALHGSHGALGALVGSALVGVLFGGGGVAQALAVRRGAANGTGILLAGLGLRIVVYIAALQALGGIDALHRPSLAVATAVAFVVTLAHEVRVISRTPQLFWVEPERRPAEHEARS
jgi:hypothetical protein